MRKRGSRLKIVRYDAERNGLGLVVLEIVGAADSIPRFRSTLTTPPISYRINNKFARRR